MVVISANVLYNWRHKQIVVRNDLDLYIGKWEMLLIRGCKGQKKEMDLHF